MLTGKNSFVKPKDLILAFLEALQLPNQVAVIHCRGHQNNGFFLSQGNSRADQIAKQAAPAQLQEPEQGMALVIGPLTSLAFPSIPHRNRKMLRNGAVRRETQTSILYRKKDNILTPEGQ